VNEHNVWIPRDHWLEHWQKEAIIAYCLDHRDDGYRRLTYMMIDEDAAADDPKVADDTQSLLRTFGHELNH